MDTSSPAKKTASLLNVAEPDAGKTEGEHSGFNTSHCILYYIVTCLNFSSVLRQKPKAEDAESEHSSDASEDADQVGDS